MGGIKSFIHPFFSLGSGSQAYVSLQISDPALWKFLFFEGKVRFGCFSVKGRHFFISLPFIHSFPLIVLNMAAVTAVIALCHIGLHCYNIWKSAAAVHSALYPRNPITLVRQTNLADHSHRIFAIQLEIYTANGSEYFFCFPLHDRSLHGGILQVFPVGTNLNKAGCQQARAQMTQMGLNHRIYSDSLHPQRTFILISTQRYELSAFRQAHWREI